MGKSSTERPYERLQAASNPYGWARTASTAIITHEALHNTGEFTVLLALAHEMQPKIVLETGTYRGGSAWAWAQLPTVDHVITVDTEYSPEAAALLAGVRPKVSVITGDSTAAATRTSVLATLEGARPDLVLIDGGHDYRTCRADFDWAVSLVRRGGILVMHDTQGHPADVIMDVPDVWAEIRQSFRTTEIADVPGGPGGTGIVWL